MSEFMEFKEFKDGCPYFCEDFDGDPDKGEGCLLYGHISAENRRKYGYCCKEERCGLHRVYFLAHFLSKEIGEGN